MSFLTCLMLHLLLPCLSARWCIGNGEEALFVTAPAFSPGVPVTDAGTRPDQPRKDRCLQSGVAPRSGPGVLPFESRQRGPAGDVRRMASPLMRPATYYSAKTRRNVSSGVEQVVIGGTTGWAGRDGSAGRGDGRTRPVDRKTAGSRRLAGSVAGVTDVVVARPFSDREPILLAFEVRGDGGRADSDASEHCGAAP